VLAVEELRLRWSGHGQWAELTVVVDRDHSLVDAHRIAHDVEHELLHALPRLQRAHVHPHPAPGDADDHGVVAHHRNTGQV
jgi:divalent metal cation (Fe/Co/Zn/Cd) transporter